MQNERIIEVLEEVYREEVSGDPEDSFQSFLEEFNETRDPELPVYWISETVISAVERLSNRRFGWHTEALKDEWNYSGEFLFICVDPTNHRCLTARTSPDGLCTIGIIFPILNIDDAVHAVEFLLSLVQGRGETRGEKD